MGDDDGGGGGGATTAPRLIPSQVPDSSRAAPSEGGGAGGTEGGGGGGSGGGDGGGGGGGGGGRRRRHRGRRGSGAGAGGGRTPEGGGGDGGGASGAAAATATAATDSADGRGDAGGGGGGCDGGASEGGGDGGGEGRRRTRRRRRGGKENGRSPARRGSSGGDGGDGDEVGDGDDRGGGRGGRGRGRGRGGRGRGGRGEGRGRGEARGGRGRGRGRGGGGGGRFPWRRFIPRGAVDPISLDPLHRLPYPPFALSAAEPYDVIVEWPIPEPEADGEKDKDDGEAGGGGGGDGDVAKKREGRVEKIEEMRRLRELKIIEEQWGANVAASASARTSSTPFAAAALTADGDMATTAASDGERASGGEGGGSGVASASAAAAAPRYCHLFDGRVLAYYLVSQLQFIDPLNRRDLTRPELVNLDRYLARHRLGRAGVAEAYDAKGVTISTAGAVGHTDEGRAERLAQEARALLNSLFEASGPRDGEEGGEGGRRRAGGGRGRGGGRQQRQEQQEEESEGRGQQRRGGFRDDFERRYAEAERRRDAGHARGGANVRPQVLRHESQPPPPAAAAAGGRGQSAESDLGIYEAEHGGMLIIDDDVNPGLRGGFGSAAASASAAGGDPYPPLGGEGRGGQRDLSAHAHAARVRADAFPALAAETDDDDGKKPPARPAAPPAQAPAAAPPGRPSKSLLKIAGTVKKTDPAEVERQRRAREEAQRRAALANMSFVPPGAERSPLGMEVGGADAFGGTAFAAAGGAGPFAPPARSEGGSGGPTDGQLERNRTLASALGVAPSTVRKQQLAYNSGWARPTKPDVQLDEFGNELGRADYSDSLIVLARERMGDLLKLERRWKTFLEDDTAASHPLRPMPRELRRLVHEYAAFWSLKTESFDPEPTRYVHCVKLRDTSAPHPLLSEAARTWRGPGTGGPPLPYPALGSAPFSGSVPTGPAGASSSSSAGPAPAPPPPPPPARPEPCVGRIPHHQAAGQSTLSREFPRTEGPREPLQLAPRTVPLAPPPGAMFDLDSSAAAATPAGQASSAAAAPAAAAAGTGRFANLHEGRERRRLELAPRTLPAELPPYRPAGYDPLSEARAEAAERRAREKRREDARRGQRFDVLADAFASDDEEEEDEEEGGGGGAGGGGGRKGLRRAASGGSDGSSDWGEEGALYQGGEEEEEEQ